MIVRAEGWSVRHGFFGRPMDFAHGSASGEADRRRALSELGGRLSELALVRQVHSARVVDVSEGALSELVTVEADALICNRPIAPRATADCVPCWLTHLTSVGWRRSMPAAWCARRDRPRHAERFSSSGCLG